MGRSDYSRSLSPDHHYDVQAQSTVAILTQTQTGYYCWIGAFVPVTVAIVVAVTVGMSWDWSGMASVVACRPFPRNPACCGGLLGEMYAFCLGKWSSGEPPWGHSW